MHWLDRPVVDWQLSDARRLHSLLKDSYPSTQRAHMVAASIGIDTTQLDNQTSPFSAWWQIMEVAARKAALRDLVNYAAKDLTVAGIHPALFEIVNNTRANSAGIVTVTPSAGAVSDQVVHLQKLLAIHERNIQRLSQQEANFAGVAPVYISNQLEDERQRAASVRAALDTAMAEYRE